MKKLAILSASVAVLALSACGDADEPADTTVIANETTATPVPGPTVTETATATTVVDGDDVDSVTIDSSGVRANVKDGSTRVTVDADGNPSVTVQD